MRPQRPRCPPAPPPPPARPAGAPRALGRGLGTARVLCPTHGAATCAACAATGHGIKYCCSLRHEGHRLAPAAHRARARAVASSAIAGAPACAPPRCWAPESGSRRGAHQRMSRRRRGSACCRRQCRGGGIGRHESALPPTMTSHRARGPLLGLGHLSPTLPGTPAPTTHGDMGGGGAGGRGVGQSQSQPRANSLSGSGLMSPGGRWLRAPPLAASSATTVLPPPLHPWARPAAGAGGKDGGARALRTFFAPSRPRSLMRRGRMGHKVTHLHPGIASSRGLQGGFGLGRVQVPPHPSASSGSRMLQGRIWGSRVLQGILWCRHRGSLRLLLWVRGVRGRAGGRDRVVPLPPWRGAPRPPGAAQSPPPPSVGGQDRHRSAAMRHEGARQRVGQTDSGAPRSTGVRQPVCRPARGGGGLLSLGFTRQVQSSGGGGAQPAPLLAGADGGAYSLRSG